MFKVTVRTSVVIDRPPEAIVRVILDAEKAPLWTSDLERFEVLSRTPDLVGSKARLHYRQGESRYVMEEEMLAVEPDRRYLSRVTGDALEAEVETQLTPTNGGTEVSIRWTGAGKPLLVRLALPFMRRAIRRQAHADLMKLKEFVESEWRRPALADEQERGRMADEQAVTVATLKQFLEAFNRHDLDAIMSFFAEECTMDLPRGPDAWGRRVTGKAAIRQACIGRFEGLPDAHYGDDRHWVCGDTGVSEWTLTGTTPAGERVAVRGTDHLAFRDGKIVRKDSYWKIVEE